MSKTIPLSSLPTALRRTLGLGKVSRATPNPSGASEGILEAPREAPIDPRPWVRHPTCGWEGMGAECPYCDPAIYGACIICQPPQEKTPPRP